MPNARKYVLDMKMIERDKDKLPDTLRCLKASMENLCITKLTKEHYKYLSEEVRKYLKLEE